MFMCCVKADWNFQAMQELLNCWRPKGIMNIKGLNREMVRAISRQKNEPDWMLQFRFAALDIFESKPMPTWGADLGALDPHDIYYYIKPITDQHTEWSDVPDKIKTTFEKLGIPQAEQKFLAGVGAQFDSEVIYKNLKKCWADQGVIF